jgi:hypothetical protein
MNFQVNVENNVSNRTLVACYFYRSQKLHYRKNTALNLTYMLYMKLNYKSV